MNQITFWCWWLQNHKALCHTTPKDFETTTMFTFEVNILQLCSYLSCIMFGCKYYFLPRSEDCNCNFSVRDCTVLLVESAKQRNSCVHTSFGSKNSFFCCFFFLADLGREGWFCEEYNQGRGFESFVGYFVLVLCVILFTRWCFLNWSFLNPLLHRPFFQVNSEQLLTSWQLSLKNDYQKPG